MKQNNTRQKRVKWAERELWQRLEGGVITRPEYLARFARLQKYRLANYAKTITNKRARASVKERGLWEAYGMELLTPEQMRASLRELATQQVKELPSESYL